MEKIVILRLNERKDQYTIAHQLPENMRSEVFKRIGSEFDKSQGMNSTSIIRGLNPIQEKIILPKLLGVKEEDASFPAKAKDYWADFTITPTVKGVRLNIATEIKKYNGEDVELPVNEFDYMMYQFAMQSSKVAKTEDELSNLGFYDFILEDLSKLKEKETKDFEAQDKATMLYARLVSKFEDNIAKIDWILEMTKEDMFYDTSLDKMEKKMLLKKLADTKPNTFISHVEDEYLEGKAFLSQAVSHLILTIEGNDYFYLNENIGSQKAALSWLKKPEKTGSVAAIKSKLTEAIKNTRR